MNHPLTHIFWKLTTIEHILFGHGPLLDIPYYVEHESQLDMDYWTHLIIGYLIPN